jgi:hypothetical protein
MEAIARSKMSNGCAGRDIKICGTGGPPVFSDKRHGRAAHATKSRFALCAAVALVYALSTISAAKAQAPGNTTRATAPAGGPSISIPGPVVAEAIRSALPDPARLNWADFHAQKYVVTASEMTIAARFAPGGKFQLILKNTRGIVVQIQGIGVDDKAIEFSASIAGFEAALDLVNREGNIELPMTISLDNPQKTAIHSEKICNLNVGVGRIAVRAWIIPQTGSAQFTMRLKARYDLDGTLSVTPYGYDAPQDSCINADITVRHAATVHGVLPLNPDRPAEIKFSVFKHMFIFRKTNPLRHAIDQMLNTHFIVGKLAPPAG